MSDKYELIKCNCSCHNNPNMVHMVTCCDNGYIKVLKINEVLDLNKIAMDMFLCGEAIVKRPDNITDEEWSIFCNRLKEL